MDLNCALNTFANNFKGNVLGTNFFANTIFNHVDHMTVSGDSFQYNNICDNVDFTGIDFTLATHVFAAYNTVILTTSTGSTRLKYVDGSDDTEKIVLAST